MKPLLRFLLPLLLAALAGPVFAQSGNPADAKKAYVHRLQLADRVRVAVYQEEDLTTLARIDARGMVNLPLIQEIQIGGLTIVEAQEAIQNAFREGRFLRSPQVTVSVEEYAPREVSISGQIRNPGRFPLPNESTYTIVELVTKAGGITDIGKGTAVTITRFLADGTKKVFTVNVDALIKGAKDAKAEDNILLLPGDNVYIPERLI
ncbi:MAG: polysaccharide biosynthesis/export family protein [Candidatus Didemnitutus sp.]|nr:polysaccharide biosynthesis/export family protein [Candidatus Didemnitutus sp.]